MSLKAASETEGRMSLDCEVSYSLTVSERDLSECSTMGNLSHVCHSDSFHEFNGVDLFSMVTGSPEKEKKQI